MRLVHRLALAAGTLTLTLGLALGIVVTTTSQAGATYQWFWGGLSMVDTENHCAHTNNGQAQCYTWIRTDGTVRRGSTTEYWSEASGGYVYTACSFAVWHSASPGPNDLYNQDFWGADVHLGHFHWIKLAGRSAYCENPKGGPGGYPWQGWPWPDIPNGAPL